MKRCPSIHLQKVFFAQSRNMGILNAYTKGFATELKVAKNTPIF
jgi:hypothetical protein